MKTKLRESIKAPRTVFLLAMVTASLQAQDLNKVMPEPVPQMVTPEPSPTAKALEEFNKQFLGAANGETVILSQLKGIILLKDESNLNTITLSGNDITNLSNFPQWDSPDFQTIIQSFVGLPVSQESLYRLKVSIRVYLSQLGMPFSVVYTPPQDITNGYVQIVIKESAAGEISVIGAKYFSDKSYLSRIRQTPGEAMDALQLRKGIDRINSNPFRAATIRVQKGKQPATTDIVIQTRERRPFRRFAGYNNTGSETTTEDRMTAGFNWGNVLGLGHQMTLQWTSDFDVHHSKAISGNYTFDLPANHSATIFGAYSRINGITAPGFSQDGESWQVGLNYDIPLTKIGKNYTQRLQLGFDFKSSDNNLELTLPPFIIPIADNLTHIVQTRMQYRGTLADDWGSTSFGAKVTYAPGDLGSYNDDDAFDTTRSKANSDYIYANFDIQRNTFLPTPLDGWNWTVRSEAQFSSGNLLGSEQFSAGGSSSVRGYEESETLGDNALFFSQEIGLPSFTPATDLFNSNQRDSLQTFVFHDYARTWNTDKLQGESPINIHSVGLGFRYQFSQYATARFAYGWQLRDSGNSDTGDNSRAHISIQLSY